MMGFRLIEVRRELGGILDLWISMRAQNVFAVMRVRLHQKG